MNRYNKWINVLYVNRINLGAINHESGSWSMKLEVLKQLLQKTSPKLKNKSCIWRLWLQHFNLLKYVAKA